MTCQQAEAALLIAEPAELRLEQDSDLAEHLRSCAGCRAKATAILNATAMLAAHLDSSARESGIDSLPVHAAPHQPTPTRAVRARGTPTRARMPDAAWLALPLAAALASVLLVRQPVPPMGPISAVPRATPIRKPVTTPVVNAAGDRNVAVFNTGENITVVWYLASKVGS